MMIIIYATTPRGLFGGCRCIVQSWRMLGTGGAVRDGPFAIGPADPAAVKILVIRCGALARELMAVARANRWTYTDAIERLRQGGVDLCV